MKRITDITEREITAFFKQMRDGNIVKSNGERYKTVHCYEKSFAAFWHWHQRIQDRNGTPVPDITRYLTKKKPATSTFVYLTINDVKRLVDHAKFEYKTLIWFLFDSGIRAPTELMNIKITDLTPIENSTNYRLHIRDEISKTYGRKIKLLLCSPTLREYIKHKQLKGNDYLFPICPPVTIRYLKRLAVRVLGLKETLGGKTTNKITLYDFRHSAACYWLPRYTSENAINYRFGWKGSAMRFYYTNLLGMSDTITEEDLIETEEKTKIEHELQQETKTRALLQDQLEAQQRAMAALKADQKNRDKIMLQILKKLSQNDQFTDIISDLKRGEIAKEIMAF